MVKDLIKSHFWIFMARGYDIQRVYDVNYSPENPDVVYLDFKYPLGKKDDGTRMFIYHRYKYYIPDRKEIGHLGIISKDNYDYNKYFSVNNLPIV